MKEPQKLLRNKLGQSAVEYAALLSVVVLVVILALVALGERASETMEHVANVVGLGTESDSALHVASIDLEARTEGSSIRVIGTVRIVDQDGQVFDGTTTSATWSVNGTLARSRSDRTDGQGRAHFTFRSEGLSTGDVVRLAVSGVAAGGYSYDSDSNVESSDQIVIP